MIKDNLNFNQSVKPNTEFLEQLRQKLPEFFTSGNNEEEAKFDMEKFQKALEEHNIEELSSGYQLDFIGKNYAKKQAGERPTTIIVPDNEHNEKIENKDSKNLFFTGDNLEVLRHLQQNYASSVDFIYIDPPYNTGSDGFVYPDKFEYSDNQLKDMFNLNDDELKSMKSIQGKSTHSAWLTFMYPRLYLAKKLLKDSGVIFVSIDDNEQANLKLLMDEVFGEGSFTANMIRLTSPQRFAQENGVNKSNDFVLSYTKNGTAKFSNIVLDKQNKKELKKDNIGKYYQGDTKAILAPVSQGYSKGGDYDFPYNGKIYQPVDSNGNRNRWFWTRDRMQAAADLGILVETSNSLRMQIYQDKKFEERTNVMVDKELGVVPTTLDLTDNKFSNPNGDADLSRVGLPKLFSYPKPLSLIKFLLNIASDKNSLVLDFFAGSGTTAEAVMQLNAEEDGSSRRFMLVQLPEPTRLDSVAYKAGYNSIDHISRARIKKAADKIKNNNPLLIETQDLGFKHYYVVEPTQQTLDKLDFDNEVQLDIFDDMISAFSSEKLGVNGNAEGLETIFQTYLVRDGYKFDVSVETLDFAGITLPYVNNQRIYIITNEWTAQNTKTLVNAIGTNEISVQTIVVYGYTIDMESLRELEIALNQLENKVHLLVRY